jgi:hypothetical protein
LLVTEHAPAHPEHQRPMPPNEGVKSDLIVPLNETF